jgi:hypothetical protein
LFAKQNEICLVFLGEFGKNVGHSKRLNACSCVYDIANTDCTKQTKKYGFSQNVANLSYNFKILPEEIARQHAVNSRTIIHRHVNGAVGAHSKG